MKTSNARKSILKQWGYLPKKTNNSKMSGKISPATIHMLCNFHLMFSCPYSSHLISLITHVSSFHLHNVSTQQRAMTRLLRFAPEPIPPKVRQTTSNRSNSGAKNPKPPNALHFAFSYTDGQTSMSIEGKNGGYHKLFSFSLVCAFSPFLSPSTGFLSPLVSVDTC